MSNFVSRFLKRIDDRPVTLYEDKITKAIPMLSILIFTGMMIYIAYDSFILNT